MVSKPNYDGDAEIRYRLYDSYQRQIPMYNYPDDYYVDEDPMISQPYGGCYNCNAAFKLGSGRMKNYSYNAYDAPSQFFYLPSKLEWYGQHIPKGGKMYRNRKPRSRYDNYDYMKKKEEAESDWYSIIKELVPLGFKLGDIVKIFYDKFAGKYGGELINDFLNLDVKSFERIAQQLGEHEYDN